MEFEPAEIVVMITILILATSVATGHLQLPSAFTDSPIASVLLVIGALGSFNAYPAVSLAIFLLVAVIFFSRNVSMTVDSAKIAYGETTIRQQPHATAAPFLSQQSGPRDYSEFQETDASNPMLGPSSTLTENFEAAPLDEAFGSTPDGQFPRDEMRPETLGFEEEYDYMPSEDMGDNTFERFGPDLDEKSTPVYA